MGAIGNIIGKAVDAATGTNSGTTLQDFLSKFSSSEGKWISQIDPLAIFDVSIKFYPSVWEKGKDGKWYEKLGDALMSSAKSAVKNAANNLTGGLLGSIMNSQVSIMDQHDKNKDVGVKTFMEYLAAANLLVGADDWVGEKAGQAVSPLELQLGPYCQEATIPQVEVPTGGTSSTQFGDFPINGLFVKPNTNVLTLKIINTKVPLHERIFYPWMREVTLPFWSYDSQPYTTATITIDHTKHSDIQYVFCGCRPQNFETLQGNHQATGGSLTRNVSFLFDAMFINSTLTNCESLAAKLLSTGKTLFNGAANMMNM